MTIVVARVFDSSVHLWSDTQITPAPHASILRSLAGVSGSGLNAILKTVILSKDIAVAFAGNVTPAMDAIQAWAPGDLDSATEHFRLASRGGWEHPPDFIIASCEHPPSLIKISEGRVEKGLTSAWIGDHSAFAKIQETAIAHRVPRDGITEAFMTLIFEQNIAGVGGFLVRASSTSNGFKYHPSMALVAPEERVVRSVEWEPILAGTAAEGGYSYSILAPREAGVGAIGLYFQQGNFGCLLYPQKDGKPIIFPNVDMATFVDMVRSRYGFTLWGPPGFQM